MSRKLESTEKRTILELQWRKKLELPEILEQPHCPPENYFTPGTFIIRFISEE
jgi:hypothetical protein